MNKPHLPPTVSQAPDPVDSELEPLLYAAFAPAWAAAAPGPRQTVAAGAIRERLLGRLARSRAESGAMFTARCARLATSVLASGVQARTLYAAANRQSLRPGEPLRARLIEVQAASHWEHPPSEHHR